MLKRRIVSLLALLLAFATQAAHAFFDPPWIAPGAPRAGETVSVNLRDGICDAIFEWPGYPQLTRQGNSIRLLEYGQHWDTADLCVFEIGQLSEPIGTFPPGVYTVTVDFAYEDALYGPTIITLGVVPFTVTGVTAAAPVPALGQSGLIALFLSIFGIALSALRTHGRSRC
jgi:hypothetical protein